jgi:hypothetical protein
MMMKRNRQPLTVAILVAVAASAIALVGAAPAGAAAPRGFFGVSAQEGLVSQDYDMMQAADVGTLREIFLWRDVQGSVSNQCTADGNGCDWGGLDIVVGNAAARGITVLPTLYGAQPGVANVRKPPLSKSQLANWKRFVQAAVDRYGPGGTYWNGIFQSQFPGASPKVIKIWQVWNEPNSHQFFPPGGDPKKYAKLLKASAQAINAGARSAKVMLGGMFGETGTRNEPVEKFTASLYKVKKIEKSFDLAAIHPYAPNAKGLLKQIDRLHDAIRKAKDKAKIWISEMGFASGGPKKAESVTKNERAQAKALTQSFKALAAKRGKYDLEGVTWFAWEDSNVAGVCGFCRFAGLVDVNGNPKPAYNAFRKQAK